MPLQILSEEELQVLAEPGINQFVRNLPPPATSMEELPPDLE